MYIALQRRQRERISDCCRLVVQLVCAVRCTTDPQEIETSGVWVSGAVN